MITYEDVSENIADTLRLAVGELNTKETQDMIVVALETYLEHLRLEQGIADYLVICDERNNPANIIDQKLLRADVFTAQPHWQFRCHVGAMIPEENLPDPVAPDYSAITRSLS